MAKKNNDIPIVTMTGDNGKQIDFYLQATVEYDEYMYGIMQPVNPNMGIAEDEVIIFRIESTNDGDYFTIEEDEETAYKVLEIYNNDLEA